MKIIKIKTLWQGQVGLPDIQLKAIFEAGQDLVIQHQEKIMTILNQDMKGRIVKRSTEQFRDRFSNQQYRLCYYDWKPDPDVQEKLL